jgi:hypothetical protein
MIVGSSWNYAKNFFDFARQFIRSAASDDFGAAFSKLDQTSRRWSRDEFVRLLAAREAGRLTSPDGHARSASPTITTIQGNDVFEVSHRLPIDGRWSDTAVSFRFVRARGDYFRVELLGVSAVSREA